MALVGGILQPEETDGIAFVVPPNSASSIKTFHTNSYLLIAHNSGFSSTGGSTGITVTFGSSSGKAPTTPSATVGAMIPTGRDRIFYLGPNRDSIRVFNFDTVNSVTVSVLPLAV
jgi:hypothetical protein